MRQELATNTFSTFKNNVTLQNRNICDTDLLHQWLKLKFKEKVCAPAMTKPVRTTSH